MGGFRERLGKKMDKERRLNGKQSILYSPQAVYYFILHIGSLDQEVVVSLKKYPAFAVHLCLFVILND